MDVELDDARDLHKVNSLVHTTFDQAYRLFFHDEGNHGCENKSGNSKEYTELGFFGLLEGGWGHLRKSRASATHSSYEVAVFGVIR